MFLWLSVSYIFILLYKEVKQMEKIQLLIKHAKVFNRI